MILSRLLKKYEGSKHLLEPGVSNRRVMLRVGSREIPEYEYESAEVRDAYNRAARECEQQGLISIKWISGRPVFSELILNLDRVCEAYHAVGRLHPRDAALQAADRIERALCGVSTLWILNWERETVRKIRETYRFPRFFSENPENLDAFLRVLAQYDALPGATITMRAFSICCFQDSKRFERDFRDEFLRAARQCDPELKEICQYQEIGWRDQLACLGIYARPEVYEMSGLFSIVTARGTMNCAPLYPHGVAIQSSAVSDIQEFDFSKIRRMVFIENKTNYDEYLNAEIREDECVMYHGGFLSPQKRRLIQKIKNSLPEGTAVLFWADIDLGGFQMFSHLRKLLPKLEPMRMSAEEVRRYACFGLARQSAYLHRLEELLEQEEYALFHEAIREILRHGVTIEQEVFLS